MSRAPKPYPYKGWYRTNAGGKRGHPLCRIDEGMTAARRALNAYLGKLESDREEGLAPRPVGSGIAAPEPGQKLAGEVHDEFLDFKKSESEPATYTHYVDKLKPFLERFGHRPIGSITEQDGIAYKRWVLTEREWVRGGKKPGQKSARVKGVGPKTCNHFLRAAKTLLTWAAQPKRRFIPGNPWEDIKLLQEKSRERLITDEEFAHLKEQASDDDFRELLVFLRYTTARPGEARMIAWDMIDWAGHCVRLDPARVKTRRPRTLTLLPEVEEMLLARKARVGGEGNVFRDGHGGEWEGVSFSQRFRRLRARCARLGLVKEEKNGEKLVLYSTRHTRNVEMIRDEGIDVAIASKEMGHAHISTTVKHYLHLTDGDVTEAVRKRRAIASESKARERE